MAVKKAQVEAQVKMKKEEHELMMQHKKHQLQVNKKVIVMMELMLKHNKKGNNK
jgi:hypothetical protein